MFIGYLVFLLLLYYVAFILGASLFPNRVYIVAVVITISVLALILYKLDTIIKIIKKQEEKKEEDD